MRSEPPRNRLRVKVTLFSPSQSRSQVVHLNRPRRWVKVEVKSRYSAPQSVKVTRAQSVKGSLCGRTYTYRLLPPRRRPRSRVRLSAGSVDGERPS